MGDFVFVCPGLSTCPFRRNRRNLIENCRLISELSIFVVVFVGIRVLFIRRGRVNDGQGYFCFVMFSEKMCVS